MIIYIAGPMSGIDDSNRPAFHSAASKLIADGHTVLNPATLPAGLSEHQYMDIGLSMLRAAEAIYLLSGWESSAGATTEYHYAYKMQLKVLHEDITSKHRAKSLRYLADC